MKLALLTGAAAALSLIGTAAAQAETIYVAEPGYVVATARLRLRPRRRVDRSGVCRSQPLRRRRPRRHRVVDQARRRGRRAATRGVTSSTAADASCRAARDAWSSASAWRRHAPATRRRERVHRSSASAIERCYRVRSIGIDHAPARRQRVLHRRRLRALLLIDLNARCHGATLPCPAGTMHCQQALFWVLTAEASMSERNRIIGGNVSSASQRRS